MTGRSVSASCLFLALLLFLSFPVSGLAASPRVPDPTCDGCGGRNNKHSSSCPYVTRVEKGNKDKSHGLSAGKSTKAQMTGMIFEGLLTSLFSDGSGNAQAEQVARQKAAALAAAMAAEEQLARAAAAQAAYNRMMQSYKVLDGSQDVAFKSLSDTSLGFKSLNDDTETMAAGARKPFDTAGPTPFFGDTMPIADIRLLVDPGNDPRVVDLRDASTFIARNLKEDQDRLADGKQSHDAEKAGRPPASPQVCEKLRTKLQGMVAQRSKFQKTVLFAREQLDTWEQANRNALLNGVKDGLEYYAGLYLEVLTKRGKAADRLRGILEKHSAQMAHDGLDTALIAQKIERLQACSSVGQVTELASNLNDWQTFTKDGLSSLLAGLTSSDQEVRELMNDPRMQEYLTTEAPELNALLDISKLAASGKVFGKWVAKKVPLIAALEISIKQAYNATDWYLSFQHIAESNQINGKVMESARSLQKHIDDTRIELGGCP